jgi:hypothetical protein
VERPKAKKPIYQNMKHNEHDRGTPYCKKVGGRRVYFYCKTCEREVLWIRPRTTGE